MSARGLRGFAVALIAALLVPLAARSEDAAPVRLGLIPSIARDRMVAELQPVADWIGARIERHVELVIANDYADIQSKLDHKDVDFAILFPVAYAQAVEANPPVELLGCSVRQGKPHYRGYVITRQDSRIHELSDLKGKTIAFVDRRSTSGFLFPVHVLEQAGLVKGEADLERFFGKVEFLGGHAAVVKAVYDGTVDAGTVYDGAIREATANGVDAGALRILARTEPIPHEAVVARAGVDRALVASFKSALLALDTRTPEGRGVLRPMATELRLNGFVDCDPKVFAPVQQLLDEESPVAAGAASR